MVDQAVKSSGKLNPVLFDEFVHLEKPFATNDERYRYLHDLQLSGPVDILRFSPGGSSTTTVCLCQVEEDRCETQILTEGALFLQKMRNNLKEFHTRTQRRLFKEKPKNVACILPSVADVLYKELALDATAHPSTQKRIRFIFLGETGLIKDLRSLNPGRPSNVYDTFFDALAGIVENIAAADDRRHGTAHMSEFISLEEMINKARDVCPEGTPIPSKSLVRLQFAPKKPYAKVALNFTSRIKVQYKIQRRQLRLTHPDDHFCNAQFRYLKERAIKLKNNCTLMFCDDKAKVPYGEPGSSVSTGVRGKVSIVPTSTTLVALDHDMTKASLTPSVVLDCNIPESIDKSFVQGRVTTVINDSIFQTASPFRHAIVLAKVMKQKKDIPPVLLKFTDGGTDQRKTLESVKCASIYLFKNLNLDMLLLGRCAPGHRYVNPAERVMSILNIGLQNVSLEQAKSSDEVEALLKKCNSVADIRTMATKNPHIKPAWLELVQPLQSLIQNRFLRLKLKEEPIGVLNPVTDEELEEFKHGLSELFPDLQLDKLQKVHTSKVESYNNWMDNHCRIRHYTFQIRKCHDQGRCSAPRLSWEQLEWLPDPVLDETGNHYKTYHDVQHIDTTESDRPSISCKKPAVKRACEQISDSETEVDPMIPEPDPHLCTIQNARALAVCVECRKPRMVYAHLKLSERQTISVALSISEFDYTCGAPILPPTHSLVKKVMCRTAMNCSTHVELAFYGRPDMWKTDICCHCGAEGAEVNLDLKKNYKTVLPQCISCTQEGKQPVVQRPFGVKK
ncbi:uncharacterized protein LOC121390784 [Gigantopelta aegis]|uniref:uncharacterized protein LOC121390784 n=1 Tax=Gigantopelta aegis TaxID=1735272 RepID=UPI001B8879E4|nr:uncharacterized protein LOC121390784 [Gigantopelta aegis]